VPLLLDTTVLIDVLRGRGAAARLLGLRSSGDVPFVCCINVEEIWRGLQAGEEDGAARLVGGLRIAPLGAGEGRRAGRWRREAAAMGITLSQADCLIAAAAVGVRARLATGNPKHFPMEELAVEHWPAGA
jgi:predicted nucleic acid-binding protein